jgi:hypothetical protein
MSRFTFGPTVGAVDLVAPPAPTGTKTDVAVAYHGVTPEGEFTFGIPAYSLATSNQLNAIHVGLYSATDTIPTNPALIVNAPHTFSTSVEALTSGGVATVDAREAPVGQFTALAVLEFAE